MLHLPLFAHGYLRMHYYPAIRSEWLPLFDVAALVGVSVASWVTWKWFETPAREAMNQFFAKTWPKRRSRPEKAVEELAPAQA